MHKSNVLSLLLAGLLFSMQIAYADNMQGMDKNNFHQGLRSETTKIHKGHGVVNIIYVPAGKINISHEAINSLKWPQMTMDFKLQNNVDLSAIKPGMAVDFELSKVEGGYQITRIVPAK